MKTLVFSLFTLFLFTFFSCKNQNQQSADNSAQSETEISFNSLKSEYIAKAKPIAMESGKTLKTKLMESIQAGGLENGLNICNTVAQKMMDSLSEVHGVKIRRTSMKIRNSDDIADQDDLEMLSFYETNHGEGAELGPEAKELADGNVRVFMPIMVEDACLKCHGNVGSDLSIDFYAKIKEKYPEDEAFNYKSGDFRGMWSITMNKM